MTSIHVVSAPTGRAQRAGIVRRALLASGIVSSVIYVANDLVNASRYPGYSILDQAISELSAVGAPTKPLWEAVGVGYDLTILAFAIGVIGLAPRDRTLRVTGWLLFAFALSGPLWLFFPMHQRGLEPDWRDTGHIVLSSVSVLLIVAYVAWGAFTLGRRFRLYSFATVLVMLAAGGATFGYAGSLAANEPTPWMGLVERVAIYAYLAWVAVFASALLTRPGGPSAKTRSR